MSTLKKILSLTLALAMLMSVSVFAGFADAGEIDSGAKAAVELLTATNIINGIENEDGTMSFNPTGTIKRAEAAKMIYVLHNKGVDDKATIWADAVTFEDCKGHWAAGYIAYCEAKNLISGRTETSFDPEAPVTGTELAKMLLTVAGYKSDVEGYTGANWEKNVAADAEAAGLFAGVKFAITQPAPRQWAAKMFANAFEADCAIYIGDYRVEGMGTTQTVKAKFLGLTTGKYVVVATETASILGVAKADKGYTKLILASKLTAGSFTDTDVKTVKYVVDNALVGQQVTLAENTSKVFGIVSTGKTISGALYANKNTETTGEKAGKWTVKVGGTLISEKAEGTTKINPILNTVSTIAGVETNLEAKKTSVEFIAFDFDGDKDIDYTYTNNTVYGTITSYTTSTGAFVFTDNAGATKSVNKDSKVDGVKVTVDGTMKANIVAKYTVDGLTGHMTFAPADVVVGTFSAISGTKYTVGGQQYEVSADKLTNGDTWFAAANLNKTAVLYTDGKYVVKAAEFNNETTPTVLPTNMAYLIDGAFVEAPKYDEFGNPDLDEFGAQIIEEIYKLKVLLADGTVTIFTLETTTGTGADKVDVGTEIELAHIFDTTNNTFYSDAANKVYEYNLTSKGKIILKHNFTTVEDVNFFKNDGTTYEAAADKNAYNAGATFTYDASKKMFTDAAIMGSENALVFAKIENVGSSNTTSYKVIKMSDLAKYAAPTVKVLAATKATIGEALLVTALCNEDAPSVETETPYVLVTTDAVKVKEGTKYYAYFTAVDLKTGVTAQYKADGDQYESITKNGVYAVRIDNGIVELVTLQNWTKDKIIAKADNLVVFNSASGVIRDTTSNYLKNAKVIVKDGSTYTLGTLADLAVAGKTSGVYNVNVYYTTDGTNITRIIIDLDGKLEFKSDAEWILK